MTARQISGQHKDSTAPYKDWGDVYFRYLANGHDNGSAAFEADRWEERMKQRAAQVKP